MALVVDVLGDDLVGAYLHGSAVLGGSLPTSDLDVLVVSRRATTAGERRVLVDALLAVSQPPEDHPAAEPARRPIELTIVVESAVRPWRFPPEMDLQFGDWDRPAYARGEIPIESPNPDLAILLDIVRRVGVALVGPPPDSVFDPVPTRDFVAASVHEIDGLLFNLDNDARNAILTLCRMWLSIETGGIARKDAAAAWAAERLDGTRRSVVDAARTMYLAGEYDAWGGLRQAVRMTAEDLAATVRDLAAATTAGQRGPKVRGRRHATRMPERGLPRPGAVLFDLDGTLVDTVETRIEAWARTFAEFDLPVERARLGPLIGVDGKRLAREVAALSGVSIDAARAEEIDRRCGEIYEGLNLDPRPLPGVGELVGALEAEGIPWAIATSSRREQVGTSVRALSLAREPRIVDGSHVEHAKPEPDLLLLAAKELGVEPTRCWYVGDATWDIASAVAAGMVPIGVTAGSAVTADILRGAGAAAVVASLLELAAAKALART